MNTQTRTQYVEIGLLTVAIITTFFSIKSHVGTYAILVLPLIGLYFFPVKLLLKGNRTEPSERLYNILSSVILGYLVAIAALSTFTPEVAVIRTICMAAALINFVFLMVLLFKSKSTRIILLHVLGVILGSTMLYT